MKHLFRKTENPECEDQARLAESPLVAVDVCGCGTMQLHIGALSVRLSQEALHELLGVLGEATAEHARRELISSLQVISARRGSA